MQQRKVIGEVERDTAIAVAKRLDAGPDDLAGGAERVEIGRFVAVNARGQDLRLEDRGRQRSTLQRFDHFEEPFEPAAFLGYELPVVDEPDVGLRLDRLDFFAKLRQRTAADGAEHIAVAPLALRAAGTELAFDEAAALDE